MKLLKLSLIIVLAVSMFSLFSKAMSMEKPPSDFIGAKRTIDLAGNYFSFSMPENFSKDMPAEPIVESAGIDEITREKNLVQRWWDVKKPGFWSKELGAVMMNINLVPVPTNSSGLVHKRPFDISNRIDLMLAAIETLKGRYDDNGKVNQLYHLPGIAFRLGQSVNTEFRDDVYNHQKWTSFSVAGPASQLIVNHILPVSMKAYVEVSFIYSPNTGIPPREFLEYAYRVTEIIEKSFHLEYADKAMAALVTESWIEQSTKDAVQLESVQNLLINNH